MKQLWTGQLHLLTPPAKSGDTRCFTYAAAWAENAEDFATYAALICARRHWTVLSTQRVMRADECIGLTAELADQINRLKTGADTCIFGVRCYYPSKTA